jgi:hypothetical protein
LMSKRPPMSPFRPPPRIDLTVIGLIFLTIRSTQAIPCQKRSK